MASIGSHRLHASLVFQEFGLAPFRRILSPELFAEAARAGRCLPKRDRPLIPGVVVWLMTDAVQGTDRPNNPRNSQKR